MVSVLAFVVSVLVSVSGAPLIGACGAPRHVYIDAGVNWCNTIRLFEQLDPHRTANYDVYGFEASPLIQPYAEHYFEWLNGERPDEPETCLPRSGSSAHLAEYAEIYGCPRGAAEGTTEEMRQCMFQKLAGALAALRTEPKLNSSALIAERLDRARLEACTPHVRSRYTLIPAAAGAAGGPDMLHLFGSPEQLIRGGAIPFREGYDSSSFSHWVRSVDFPTWFETSFSARDHLVLKMDIEGAEHSILNEMLRRRLLPLVDVLSLECHHRLLDNTTCPSLLRRIKAQSPDTNVLIEGKHHHGYDSRSKDEANARAGELVALCANLDLRHFTVSRVHNPVVAP